MAIIQECINRPVQIYSPTKDLGQDGVFGGTISDGTKNVRSIIQCKHTSNPNESMKFSYVSDEITKMQKLIIECHNIRRISVTKKDVIVVEY